MTVDFCNEQDVIDYNGEEVTLQVTDMGDLQVMPCTSRIKSLAPTWREHGLTARDVHAVVRVNNDDDLTTALDMLGVPDEAMTWLNTGYAICFTCIALEMLDTVLFHYQGISY